MKNTRVLLIQMPFLHLQTPSIDLSNLRAALEAKGFACDLKYLNIELGKQLGVDLYDWIADMPTAFLFGDLVFAPILHNRSIGSDRLKDLMAPFRGYISGIDSARVLETYPDLVASSEAFLTEMVQRGNWSDYGLVVFSTKFQVAPSLAMARALKSSLHVPPKVLLQGNNCEGEMGENIGRQFPFVDYVCRGEAERLVVELAQHLEDGSPSLEKIQGLVWRKNGEILCNGAKPDVIDDLDSLPSPRYDDWLDTVKQARLLDDSSLCLPIETARGCWYGEKQHCTFCGLNGHTMMFRRKSPERAFKEFTDLMKSGVKMIYAVDYILDFRYFTTLLPALAELRHDCEIHYEIKSNMTYDQLRLLRSSGCRDLQPGIESLATPVLKLMQKGVTAAQNIRLLKWAAELGVSLTWNMIYGFPDENPQDYLDMAAFVPLLAHLQPPRQCMPVRIDRFSPLFKRDKDHLRPFRSYFELYPFENEIVAGMAYHFEPDDAGETHPESHIATIIEAVREWHKDTGRAAFICLNNDPGLRLIDSRSVALNQGAILHGLEEEIFRGCLVGARLDHLCRVLDRSEDELRPILESFIDRRWAILLDDQYITLAVPMDDYVPGHLPPAMVESWVRDLHCTRMANFLSLQSVVTDPGFKVGSLTLTPS